MTIAELHGKISHTGANLHDQMEDLLTSDVFSACKYGRPSTLLLPFLQNAVDINGAIVGNQISSNIKSVDYRFWPMLAHGEPDLLLCLHEFNHKNTLILIEAKYFSSKSGSTLDPDEIEAAQAPSDQLAREYLDLLEAHNEFGLDPDEVEYRCLIYLTAHRVYPKSAIQESLGEISRFIPQININLFWNNWFDLQPLLTGKPGLLPWEKPILDDLQMLVERKRLIAFPGFTPLIQIHSIEQGSIYMSRKHIKRTQHYWELKPLSPVAAFYTRRSSERFC